MEKYELTLVLSAKAKAKEKTVKEKIEKFVLSLKGKAEKYESWGEIELSYKIKKETSGIFLHFNLELEKESVKELDAALRVDDNLLRYLLVKKD